jgi:hypothetical protein
MFMATRARFSASALPLAAAAALAASCTGHPTATSRTGEAASPAAATANPSLSAPAEQALAAYTAMWADVQVLSETSNYTDPRLSNHLDGQAYATISENMSVNKAHGIIGLGAPVLHAHVLTVNATTVTLADCMDDTHWLEYYSATRKPVDNTPGAHRYTTATVTDENGTWKVTAIDTRGDGSCT